VDVTAVQEIDALCGQLAEVSAAKSAAEASLASSTASSTATTGEVERLKKSEAECKKELTRLSKQVQELSAAKSELEQQLRDRESASVRVAPRVFGSLRLLVMMQSILG
jgi:chromosome segregation ATPase